VFLNTVFGEERKFRLKSIVSFERIWSDQLLKDFADNGWMRHWQVAVARQRQITKDNDDLINDVSESKLQTVDVAGEYSGWKRTPRLECQADFLSWILFLDRRQHHPVLLDMSMTVISWILLIFHLINLPNATNILQDEYLIPISRISAPLSENPGYAYAECSQNGPRNFAWDGQSSIFVVCVIHKDLWLKSFKRQRACTQAEWREPRHWHEALLATAEEVFSVCCRFHFFHRWKSVYCCFAGQLTERLRVYTHAVM